MKKPNKLYKNLGGQKTPMGRAFAAAFSPRHSLKSLFGRDPVARDAADGFNLDPSRYSLSLVMATIRGWQKTYHGPSISWMFKLLNTPKRPIITDTRQPK